MITWRLCFYIIFGDEGKGDDVKIIYIPVGKNLLRMNLFLVYDKIFLYKNSNLCEWAEESGQAI